MQMLMEHGFMMMLVVFAVFSVRMDMGMGVCMLVVVAVTADMVVVQMHKATPLHSNAFYQYYN